MMTSPTQVVCIMWVYFCNLIISYYCHVKKFKKHSIVELLVEEFVLLFYNKKCLLFFNIRTIKNIF